MDYAVDAQDELPGLQAKPTKLEGPASGVVDDQKERKVFVSHGKKRDLVPQLKEFLEIAEFEPVVSVERESVSKPVPEKVMDDMRSCSAAIIHVDGDREVTNDKGEKETLLNENVLIEIGAALALYRRRFILLVQNGAKLPSNLQGLFEVRYEGEKMDAEAALRLLKSLKDLKNQPITRIA
jgi:predicted nucleotide-binding protein